MKKFPGIIILLIVVFIMSCKDDEEDTWTQYQKWRNENAAYFNQKRAETEKYGFLPIMVFRIGTKKNKSLITMITVTEFRWETLLRDRLAAG